ncbi:MAG: GTPase ObgE [Rhodospirillales bacterium]
MFVDRAKIHVCAGHGGGGCVSFRREKFIPRGGPNGGDGGRGGDVILRADRRCSTLNMFHHRQHFTAPAGRNGEGSNRHGHAGEATVVPVPVGTVVFDDAGGAVVADLAADQQEFRAAAGGRGGRGNARFASSTHQAPREAEPGDEGESRWLRLELRLLADIGLVGFPNVGKSTLLARLTAARPKVAAYPFTTLTPHLGVLELDRDASAVIADIPGLIHGAHAGAGLGDLFLQHLRRTRVLVHLVDAAPPAGRTVLGDYLAIRHELEAYGGGLCERPEMVFLSRCDRLEGDPDIAPLAAEIARRGGPAPRRLSALTGEGLPALRAAVRAALAVSPPGEVVLTLREKRR